MLPVPDAAGSVKVEIQDIASGVFRVLINQSATGSEATPFSAAVS